MQRLLCFFLLFSVASCGEWYECGMEWRPCEDIYANAEQRYVARRRGEEAQKIERLLPTRNRNKISIDVHCTAHSMRLCCLCVSCTLFYVGSAVFDDALKLHAVAGDRCHVWAFFACWLNMIFRRGKCTAAHVLRSAAVSTATPFTRAFQEMIVFLASYEIECIRHCGRLPVWLYELAVVK